MDQIDQIGKVDEQIDRWIEREFDSQIDSFDRFDGYIGRQIDRQRKRKKDRWINRQIDRVEKI